MKNISIGQMAKLNHISEQTLRLYDRLGLLIPYNRDSETNYRYYDIKQCAQLDMIQYMKSLGMNLKDIKEHLKCKEISGIKSILYQKSKQIDEQINELKFQKRAVERTIKSFERYESSPPNGKILVEYIEKRKMYCIDSGVNFYDYGIETYEKILRELKERLIADHLPQIYFCNAGSILRQENLVQHRFYSTEVFVFVDQDFVPSELITTIPASNYICIYCDKFEKEKEYAEKLLRAVKEEGYIIYGDYICEVIAELPLIDNGERGMFLRLQIPIKFS